MCEELHWTKYISAFSVPIIAFIGLFIAYRQWRTARYGLMFDLFERRYKVYVTLRDFQQSVIGSGRVEEEKLIAYCEGIRGARWLFGERVYNYLYDDIHANAIRLQTKRAEMEDVSAGPERSTLVRKETEIMKDLSKHLAKADAIFMPFLDVSRVV